MGQAASPTATRKALTALAWAHINPYGTFHIDMSIHLDLGPASGLAEAA
ncbi:MAG: hypothetical protein WBP81_03100 [Solirubrobacteraceae bacterium]